MIPSEVPEHGEIDEPSRKESSSEKDTQQRLLIVCESNARFPLYCRDATLMQAPRQITYAFFRTFELRNSG